MSDPKYQLNRKDTARWRALLTRHCLNYVDVAGKQHRSKKFPPLSTAEALEFEKLSRMRNRKLAAHPKVRASILASRQLCRKANRLLAKAEALRDLWLSIEANNEAAYVEGFAKGNNLLLGLAGGDLTAKEFNERALRETNG